MRFNFLSFDFFIQKIISVFSWKKRLFIDGFTKKPMTHWRVFEITKNMFYRWICFFGEIYLIHRCVSMGAQPGLLLTFNAIECKTRVLLSAKSSIVILNPSVGGWWFFIIFLGLWISLVFCWPPFCTIFMLMNNVVSKLITGAYGIRFISGTKRTCWLQNTKRNTKCIFVLCSKDYSRTVRKWTLC